MVMSVVPPDARTPFAMTAEFVKKSKILLLVIEMPLFRVACEVVVPLERIPFAGKVAATGPMLLFVTVLLSLPVAPVVVL